MSNIRFFFIIISTTLMLHIVIFVLPCQSILGEGPCVTCIFYEKFMPPSVLFPITHASSKKAYYSILNLRNDEFHVKYIFLEPRVPQACFEYCSSIDGTYINSHKSVGKDGKPTQPSRFIVCSVKK